MFIIQANGDEVEEVYEKIDELINLISSKEYIIIMGGWNPIEEEDQDRK